MSLLSLSLLSGLGMVFILFLLCLAPPAAITTSDGGDDGDFGVVVVVASAVVAVLFVGTTACIPTIVVVVDVALVALAPVVVALLLMSVAVTADDIDFNEYPLLEPNISIANSYESIANNKHTMTTNRRSCFRSLRFGDGGGFGILLLILSVVVFMIH